MTHQSIVCILQLISTYINCKVALFHATTKRRKNSCAGIQLKTYEIYKSYKNSQKFSHSFWSNPANTQQTKNIDKYIPVTAMILV